LPSWAGRVALVTGVGGFIGSALAAELLERDAKVVGIVRDSAGMRMLETLAIHRRIDVVAGSVGDAGLLLRAINEYDVDTIFHLAAQTFVSVANRSPVPTFETNVAGTWNVLEAARQSPLVQRVVVASCGKAYHDQSMPPSDGETRPRGLYPYAASKACADILAQSYATTFPLPVATVRTANVYGPGDLNWLHLVPGTIRSALSGDDPIVRSDGTPEREYLYLDDAVDGYLTVAERLPELTGRTLDLGTGRTYSVLQVVRRILTEVADAGLQPRVLAEAAREVVQRCVGYAEARATIGWVPAVGIDEGLARTVRWYRAFLATGNIVAIRRGALS